MARRPSLVSTLVAGAIAGTAATWLMDAVTTVVQKLQPPEDAERERAAWPNDQPSVVNLVDLVADRLAVRLDERTRPTAASVAHYALGAVPGAVYAVLRGRLPAPGAGHGLLYGALLWVVNDEYLNARLGLSAPPAAYPLMTHVRRADRPPRPRGGNRCRHRNPPACAGTESRVGRGITSAWPLLAFKPHGNSC